MTRHRLPLPRRRPRPHRATTDDDDHVRDLIEQVLFTAPGERVNRPDFGSGLLQLVFAPNSPELAAAAAVPRAGRAAAVARRPDRRRRPSRSTPSDATLRVDRRATSCARTGERRTATFDAGGSRDDAARVAADEDRAAPPSTPATPRLNGIDFLEVSTDDQRDARACTSLRPLPGQPSGARDARSTATTSRIDGGRADRATSRVGRPRRRPRRRADDVLARAHRQRRRLLDLHAAPRRRRRRSRPPPGFDPPLAERRLLVQGRLPDRPRLRAGRRLCRRAGARAASIDYLAKDYASFRRLILDRLRRRCPTGRERNAGRPRRHAGRAARLRRRPPQLLPGRRRHRGLPRHRPAAHLGAPPRPAGRLPVHDGSNARAWIVRRDRRADRGRRWRQRVPAGSADRRRLRPRRTAATRRAWSSRRCTTSDAHASRTTRSRFYTWGDDECCLPAGATAATLRGAPAAARACTPATCWSSRRCSAPTTGRPGGRRPYPPPRRAAWPPTRSAGVRPADRQDGRRGRVGDDDALPFPLCLRRVRRRRPAARVQAVVARGNVVLADHGRHDARPAERPRAAARPPDRRATGRCSRRTGLTQARAVRRTTPRSTRAPAAAALDARPARRAAGDRAARRRRRRWDAAARPARPATASPPSSSSRPRTTAGATLRFGDGVDGRRADGRRRASTPRYRIGNGAAGNVGAEALVHAGRTPIDGVDASATRCPPPAASTRSRLEQVAARRARRRSARQERAVTAADYAAVAERHPDVQRAAATRRWTGSWYTVFVTVDRARRPPGRRRLRGRAARVPRALPDGRLRPRVDAPRYVPLELALTVCVEAGHVRATVSSARCATRSARHAARRRRGFFHPDNFTFGQPVYLSQRDRRARRTSPGVERVVSVDALPAPRRSRRAARSRRACCRSTGSRSPASTTTRASPENGTARR